MKRLALSIIVLLSSEVALASERPFSTDRPDRTESPFTVPARYYQLEMDLVSHGRLEFDGGHTDATYVTTLNAKYGVTNRMDLQATFAPFVRVTVETDLSSQTATETGPAGLRLKYNLFGNDTGTRAMALLPFASVPTYEGSALDAVTWGILTPIAFDIGGDRAISLMAGFARVENEHTWWTASVSFATPLAGALAGFVELYASRDGFDSDAEDDLTADVGFTYAPGDRWQLDGGVYYGIADETERWRVFAGLSIRGPV